jgi:Rha family phage regulatory protein
MLNNLVPMVELDRKKEMVFTTSLEVARIFNKRHDNVMQAIGNLECSEQFRLLNFKETVYKRKNPSGGRDIKAPMYLIRKDGFVFLAMGFTGKKAAQFKEAYIQAFNQMEAILKDKLALTENYKKMTHALQETRALQGKDTKFYHYCTEADMLNRIVFGKSSKELVEEHGEEFRQALDPAMVKLLGDLEHANSFFIDAGFPYEERKQMLESKANRHLRLA